jgi:hypothetical protein
VVIEKTEFGGIVWPSDQIWKERVRRGAALVVCVTAALLMSAVEERDCEAQEMASRNCPSLLIAEVRGHASSGDLGS